MGEIVRLDFQTGQVTDREPSNVFDIAQVHTMRDLKPVSEITYDEVMEQAAYVAAAHNLAISSGDLDDIMDITLTLQEALGSLTAADIEEVWRRAQKIIDAGPMEGRSK